MQYFSGGNFLYVAMQTSPYFAWCFEPFENEAYVNRDSGKIHGSS